MHYSALLSAAVAAIAVQASPIQSRQEEPFAGYLLTDWKPESPQLRLYLSDGNNPGVWRNLDLQGPEFDAPPGEGPWGGAPRDTYLTTNDARDKFYLLATDLDVDTPGFSWAQSVVSGSKSLIIWESTDLVNWAQPRLVKVEDDTAGMVWAPSAVWDAKASHWQVFWASRFYAPEDTEHTGPATWNYIRTASTRDFVTFTPAVDYIKFNEHGVIDQEFQYLGTPDHFARFIKNETTNQIYQEMSTTGLFGDWARKDGYVRPEAPVEGAASFEDNEKKGTYYLLLDHYLVPEYKAYATNDIDAAAWGEAGFGGFPRGLRHGSVTPLKKGEYDGVAAKWPA